MEANAFVKAVRDRMFFKCPQERGHRAEGPIPGALLCEGCVLDEMRSILPEHAASEPEAKAPQPGEPGLSLCCHGKWKDRCLSCAISEPPVGSDGAP